MRIVELGAVVTLALALALAGNTRANNGDLATVPEFLEYLAEVREATEAGEPRKLSRREQRLFDSADRDIRSLLEGKSSIDELSEEEAVALYNSQEQIQGVLLGAEDTRAICRRQSQAGTHFRQTRCVSAATRAEQQEAAQELLRRFPTEWRAPGMD